MNRFLLVSIMFGIAACATPSPEPNRPESVQVVESGGDELQAQNNPVENYEGVEEIEAPSVSEIPSEMIPGLREPELEIICERVAPPGSLHKVEVCRRRSDIARRTQSDQELFDDIKRNTANGASRL